MTTAEQPEQEFRVENVHLDKLVPSESNVRRRDISTDVDQLAANIRQLGLQQPIVVQAVPDTDRFEIIIGQRRYLAFKQLRRETIPARIISNEMTELEAKARSFSENTIRHDLDPRDKADVCVYMLGQLHTIKEVAVYLGVSEPTVRRWLDYADVPNELKEFVQDKKLTRGQATRIWHGVNNVEKAKEVAVYVIEHQPAKQERDRILTAAEELPDRSMDKILDRARELGDQEPIIFVLPDGYRIAMEAAARRLDKDANEIARDATLGWLDDNEFVSGV